MKLHKLSKSIVLAVSAILIFSILVGSTVAFIFDSTDIFRNEFNIHPAVGDLIIKKTVQHNFGESYVVPSTLNFEFNISLGSSYANQTITTSIGDYETDSNGMLKLNIKPEQKVTLHNIAKNTTVKVSESYRSGFSVKDGSTKDITVIHGETVTLDFINIYSPKPISPTPTKPDTPPIPANEARITLTGIKNLEGREWQDGDEFLFVLEYKDGDKYVEVDRQSVSYSQTANNDFSFDFTDTIKKFAFNTAGKYEFRVRELEGSIADIEYDKSEKLFNIYIGDEDMDGFLDIDNIIAGSAVNVNFDEETQKFNVTIEFNNKYNYIEPEPIIEPIKVEIPITNIIINEGNIAADLNGFRFVIENIETGEKQIIITDEEGVAKFVLEFTESNLGKGKYKIYALDNGEEGITHSENVYEIEIDVTLNDQTDKLEATIVHNGESVDEETIKFHTVSNLNSNEQELDDILWLAILFTVVSIVEICLLFYQIHAKRKSSSVNSNKLCSFMAPTTFFGLLVPYWQVLAVGIAAALMLIMLTINVGYAVYIKLSAKQKTYEPQQEPENESQAEPEPVVNPEPVTVVIPILETVRAEEVNELMTDSMARANEQKSNRIADPTKKGFVNIDVLATYFSAGETVTLEEIKKRIPNVDKNVTFYKVLARGTLDKPLIVDADAFSIEAEKMILLTGGTVLKSVKPTKK